MKYIKLYYYTFVVFILASLMIVAQERDGDILKIPNTVVEINCKNLNGERILFVKKRVLSNLVLGDIYSMNPIGGDVQKITNLSDIYCITELPEISRDGTKITFVSNFESWKSAFYTDVFMIDLSNGSFKRITGFEKTTEPTATATVNVTVADPQNWAFSPSAIRISYSGCSDFVLNNTATLTVPANEGIWVKAEIARAKGDLKVLNVSANGSTDVQLDLTAGTISAESSNLSADNKYLAVSTNSETMNFPFFTLGIWDVNTLDRITEVGTQRLGGDIFPAFSPDNSMIAYATGEYTLNSLGVISTSNLNSAPTILVPGSKFGIQGFCSQPTWSPDGTEIIYVFTTINGLDIQSNLYKVSVNGGEPKQLTFYSGSEIASKPTYSSDGAKVAFNQLKSNSGGIFSLLDLVNYTCKSDIYFIPSNGGQAVALTSDGASLNPSWGFINSAVDIHNKVEDIPKSFSLSQNYPNPFNPSTTIEFTIPNTDEVSLIVYDILGKKVAELVNEKLFAGEYKVKFNASANLSSGVYIYRLITNNYSNTRLCILIK